MADPREGLDENGFITTGAHASNLMPPFAAIVDDAVAVCSDALPDLHSLYVYGSTTCGTARIGQSDVDLLAVLSVAPDREAARVVSQQLSRRYSQIVREVSVATASLGEVLAETTDGLASRCFIRHYCICVAGDDMTRSLPRCRPSAALIVGLTADTAPLLDAARFANDSNGDPATLARSAARKLLLTAAGIVSLRSGDWTTDRSRAASALAAAYPERARQLQRAAAWAVLRPNAPVDRDELREFLNDFGSWVLTTLQQALQEPSR